MRLEGQSCWALPRCRRPHLKRIQQCWPGRKGNLSRRNLSKILFQISAHQWIRQTRVPLFWKAWNRHHHLWQLRWWQEHKWRGLWSQGVCRRWGRLLSSEGIQHCPRCSRSSRRGWRRTWRGWRGQGRPWSRQAPPSPLSLILRNFRWTKSRFSPPNRSASSSPTVPSSPAAAASSSNIAALRVGRAAEERPKGNRFKPKEITGTFLAFFLFQNEW